MDIAILDLIAQLYDLAMGAGSLAPALDNLVTLVGADHAFGVVNGVGAAPVLLGAQLDQDHLRLCTSPDAMRMAQETYGAAPPRRIYTTGSLIADTEFAGTELYNEIVKPLGGFYGLGLHNPALTDEFLLFLCRPRSFGDFEAREIRTVRQVIRHFANAIALQTRLERSDAALADLERRMRHLQAGADRPGEERPGPPMWTDGAIRHGGLRTARLSAIKDDIIAQLTDRNLDVEMVARRHGISPRYVRSLFEGEGINFTTFLLAARLDLAHRMLAEDPFGVRPVKAIALDAGFGDLSYFNHSFRRRFGLTPSEARSRAKAAFFPDR